MADIAVFENITTFDQIKIEDQIILAVLVWIVFVL